MAIRRETSLEIFAPTDSFRQDPFGFQVVTTLGDLRELVSEVKNWPEGARVEVTGDYDTDDRYADRELQAKVQIKIVSL